MITKYRYQDRSEVHFHVDSHRTYWKKQSFRLWSLDHTDPFGRARALGTVPAQKVT